MFIWHNIGDWKTFQTELSWLSTCVRFIMHEIFIYSGIENGDYTGSKHYTVYKLNVISQCSSVTPYLVVISLFFYLFTFKNKPDISFVHYKLEIYIVGVKISGKNNLKKKWSKSHLESGGPVFKHPVIFYIIIFLATLQKCTSRCIYHIGLVISRANKIYEY